jgi:hypothetical protein
MLSCAFVKLGRRGALSLEFALAAMPMTILLLGGIEMARYLYTVQALHSHTDALLRAALVHVGADSKNRCLADLSGSITRPVLPVGVDASRLTQDQPRCQQDNSSRTLLVSAFVSYRFSFAIRLFGAGDVQISRTAQQSL